MHQCDLFSQQPLDEYLDPSTRRLCAEQAGTHHPGIVEHQKITRTQQGWQGVEIAIDWAIAVRWQVQQPAVAAPTGRPLGDQLVR